MKNQYCNDVDGNRLFVGDLVVVIDIEDLDDAPKRGQLLKVTYCADPESNMVLFGDYGFYAHRVLKVVNTSLTQ